MIKNELLKNEYIKNIKFRDSKGSLYLAFQTYINYKNDGGILSLFEILKDINDIHKNYYIKELKKL